MEKTTISLDSETFSILREMKDTLKISFAGLIRMAIRDLYKKLCP